MRFTRGMLDGHARFDDDGLAFTLDSAPAPVLGGDPDAAAIPDAIPLGRYELPRRSADAHVYRLQHPLAQSLLKAARAVRPRPVKRQLDYDGYGATVAALRALKGTQGVAVVSLVCVQSVGTTEEFLLAAAAAGNQSLDAELTEKLLSLPGRALPLNAPGISDAAATPLGQAAPDAGATAYGPWRTEVPPAVHSALEPVKQTSFIEERLLERKDLQRLLKADISVIGDDMMVIAEEFGDWEESNRRIDLLCLDKQARLVVVEIKRTEDGGHMELQAIRYAAMVSSMTLDQAIAAYARMLATADAEVAARREILEFLELDSAEEAELTDEVRIVLVSADFSTELTTSVIWLNRHGIDLTSVRLEPYRMGDELLIDAAQIIPLPEAADYEIKVRAQAQEIKKVRTARQEIFRRFWAQYIDRSRGKTALYSNRSTSSDHWISAGIGRSGFGLNASLTEDRARVECYISMGKESDQRNKAAFRALHDRKSEIEQAFGGPLDWQELPNRIGCRICADMPGGWKTPEQDWADLQDRMLNAMVRLEAALKAPVQALRV